MTAPTLDEVRAWLLNSLQWHEIARSAAAGPWAPPGTASGHFPLAHDPVAFHRLAIAALDDAERWRAVRLDGSVHAQSFTVTPHNTMTETAQSIHVVAGPVAGTYADMWADHLRDAARRDGA